jgi:SAM-dependent methyltransferase
MPNAPRVRSRLRALEVRMRRGVEWAFRSDHYTAHTASKLAHLADLDLPTDGMSVLEVGAGIGDLSGHFVERGNRITITDARDANVAHLRRRYPPDGYPEVRVAHLDLNDPTLDGGPFDLVFCYGVLYHLHDPAGAIAFLAEQCGGLMLVETCVTPGDDTSINLVDELRHSPTQSISGTGCRPTRPWVFDELRRHFEHVYLTRTQPDHPEFPIDWVAAASRPAHAAGSGADRDLTRAVFVASRTALDHDSLADELLDHQVAHPSSRSAAQPVADAN